MDELRARRLRNVISNLSEQRHVARSAGASFACHLIDLAIMQVRLTLSEISEEELFEFSNVLSLDVANNKKAD
jgi:hypothetical protein